MKADSPGSILLVFQAILPFLLFAGEEERSPITITIQGGTNISFSLSFEYLHQVLLPSLERFGVKVERKLEFRGWTHGPLQIGSVQFEIHPLEPGEVLKEPNWPTERGKITKIDVSMIVPEDAIQPFKKSLAFELGLVFPDVELHFHLVENSRHKTRLHTLLVAHTSTGLRFSRDFCIMARPKTRLQMVSAQKLLKKLLTNLMQK